VFEEVHGPVDFKSVRVSVAAGKNVDGASTFQTEGHICIDDLYESLGMKYVEFSCKQNEDIQLMNEIIEKTTKQTVNAFQLLMSIC